jgi:hypothetical protein
MLVITSSGNGFAGGPPPIPEGFLIQETTGCFTLMTTGDGIAIFGQGVYFENGTTGQVTVVNPGFWNFALAPDDTANAVLHSAGSYVSVINCPVDQTNSAVKVKVKAPGSPSSATFSVRWAISSAPNTWRFDVRVKVGSGGSWRTWRNDTSALSATYAGSAGRTYFFRARTVRPSLDQMTAWSPNRRVRT